MCKKMFVASAIMQVEAEKGDIPAMHKFIRMFAYPYRMVLIDDGNEEGVGFVLFGDVDDKEEIVSTMEWIE